LVVQVSIADTPLENAPIDFSVVQGVGGIATDPSGSLNTLLHLRTDTNGLAQVYYVPQSGTTHVIDASVSSEGVTNHLQFVESIGDLKPPVINLNSPANGTWSSNNVIWAATGEFKLITGGFKSPMDSTN